MTSSNNDESKKDGVLVRSADMRQCALRHFLDLIIDLSGKKFFVSPRFKPCLKIHDVSNRQERQYTQPKAIG